MFWSLVLVPLVVLLFNYLVRDAKKKYSVMLPGPAKYPVFGSVHIYRKRDPEDACGIVPRYSNHFSVDELETEFDLEQTAMQNHPTRSMAAKTKTMG
ncbi:hypothetical protein quinque_001522 [Culex quinquefasciatus]